VIDWKALHGDHFAGVRVLVTGGAGFIGSHLVETLVMLGADVVAFDDLSGGTWDNLDGFGESVSQLTGSILDEDAIASATKGCRYVFHQAALGSVPRSIELPSLYYDVNVGGTVNVLKAAHEAGVQRLMFASSSSVYGNPPNDEARSEDQPLMPLSPYAATKAAGEHALAAWAESYGLDTVAIRYFNVFGPRQNANSAYAAVIGAFGKAMAAGERCTIYGDGEQGRDFTYVSNVVHGNLLVARNEKNLVGEIFNIACGGRITVNQLHERMADLFEADIEKAEYAEARSGEVRMSQAVIKKAKSILGLDPIVSFEDGLSEYLLFNSAIG
jgi:UDP-glucose 4-epimerase